MSEMLQRVTDAIKKSMGEQMNARSLHGNPSSGDWHAKGDPGAIDIALLARAAMEAMREPTDTMYYAGWKDEVDVARIYRIMIDAALSEDRP